MDQLFEFEGGIPPKDTLQIYLKIIGLPKLPRSASEMPLTVNLPSILFGNIENSILQTNADGLERAQMSFFDSKAQQFKHSKVFTGRADSTGIEHTFFKMLDSLFGQKPLLSWHTHPNGTWYFSTQDVASAKGFQRQGYISIVGSIKGIVAMMQTHETAKMPLNARSIYDKTIKSLRQREFIEKDIKETARMIEELGFGYYFWFPGRDLVSGDISETIQLSNIHCYK